MANAQLHRPRNPFKVRPNSQVTKHVKAVSRHFLHKQFEPLLIAWAKHLMDSWRDTQQASLLRDILLMAKTNNGFLTLRRSPTIRR
jgi:hypothetical protein